MVAANFKSSFIPTIPSGSTTGAPFKKKGTGIIGILAITLFIVSILAAVGSYAYKTILQSSIENVKMELAVAEDAIDKETIHSLSIFSSKLAATRSIINKHQVISNVMSVLEEETVSAVYFTDFSYDALTLQGLMTSVSGKANSYAALALQDSILRENPKFKSIEVSDLTLDDKGMVSFKLIITVDPATVIYQVDNPLQVTNAEEEVFNNIDDLEAGLNELDQIDEDISNL